jgi:sortase A
MTLYRYVKAPPKRQGSRHRPVVISYLLVGFGGGLLLWAVWPILSFTIASELYFSKIITPVADSQAVATSPLSSVAFAAGSVDALVTPSSADFSNANTWYPAVPQKHIVTPVNTYTLSIPKLKIENALVTIAGDDLHASLVHYRGTGLPGQYGNAVVFGHSTLPQFFSPTNYTTIFSVLPALKIGDDVMVTYDGVTYRYTVYEMVVLDPTDLSVLEQRFDDSYLTLVTCVPPGTMWKRLNVRAKLNTL